MHAAMDQGVWFNIYGFGSPLFDPYRAADGLDALMARNDSLRLAAQSDSSPDLKVVLPEGYSPDREYPLFIALHGGGGNMEDFSTIWTSDLLTAEYIVAYPQSSLLVSMTGYAWTQDLEVSRREITDAYRTVVDDYPIDLDEVVVGGFSAGGIAALEVMLEDDFPIAGFVVLCPARPEGFTTGPLAAVRDRGVRGTTLTTEMDPNIESQREMARLLEAIGFPHQFVVTPDIGHWFPDNLGELIDTAILHIRER
jgi:phospholipase/carboxylesterase